MMGFILFIGFILGAIGGGGGLLILPVLVYFQDMQTDIAAPISMSLVGVSAAITLVSQKSSWKEWANKDLITYAAGSLLMIYTTKWALGLLKLYVIQTNEWIQIWDHMLMLLFIPVILLSAWNAWPREKPASSTKHWNILKGFAWGSLTGCLAGLFGAGGGFIIVPVLHQGAKFPIQKAIGASLLIIAINGTFGGLAPLVWNHQLNSSILLWMSLMAVGAVAGRFWSKKQQTEMLKKSLAIFLTAVASAIFVKEIYTLI
jgi:uncharacterized membrane protein YfcA